MKSSNEYDFRLVFLPLSLKEFRILPDPFIPARKCEIVDLYFVYKFRENSKFVFRETMW